MLIKFADHLKPAKVLSRPHVGTVVDNADPEKLGRVRCTVKNLFEGDTAKLPWIIPDNLDPKKMDVPKVGDQLQIVFPYGDVYHGFYKGGLHNALTKSSEFDADYPNTFGFVKENIKLLLNDSAKKGEFVIGDFSVNVKEDGSVEMNLTDFIQLITGKLTLTVTGDIEISGDANAKFSGKSGTDVGDASSITNVKGTQVQLAGGGLPVAVLTATILAQAGNLGAPVVGQILEGSSKVTAPK